MKHLILILLLIAPSLADQRDGSNSIPFLPPDPSLKTTDSFYMGSGCIYLGPVPDQDGAYQLPPIFANPNEIGAELSDASGSTLNLTEHEKKMRTDALKIVAANSYDLSEDEMTAAKIGLGEENYL